MTQLPLRLPITQCTVQLLGWADFMSSHNRYCAVCMFEIRWRPPEDELSPPPPPVQPTAIEYRNGPADAEPFYRLEVKWRCAQHRDPR